MGSIDSQSNRGNRGHFFGNPANECRQTQRCCRTATYPTGLLYLRHAPMSGQLKLIHNGNLYRYPARCRHPATLKVAPAIPESRQPFHASLSAKKGQLTATLWARVPCSPAPLAGRKIGELRHGHFGVPYRLDRRPCARPSSAPANSLRPLRERCSRAKRHGYDRPATLQKEREQGNRTGNP